MVPGKPVKSSDKLTVAILSLTLRFNNFVPSGIVDFSPLVSGDRKSVV